MHSIVRLCQCVEMSRDQNILRHSIGDYPDDSRIKDRKSED